LADSADETQLADALYNLGLFSGTGTDSNGMPVFNLENKLSRQEATALLVRLLGKEAEAQKENFDTPFTDVDDWAKPYVGYAYNQGLVSGIGETSFGSKNSISATEYLTLILRALGYDDKQGDFVCHSHPYIGDLNPSMSDLDFLKSLTWQKDSIIIDPSGEMVTYDKYGVKEKMNVLSIRNQAYYDEIFKE
jgi:hypothetical protein